MIILNLINVIILLEKLLTGSNYINVLVDDAQLAQRYVQSWHLCAFIAFTIIM